MRRDCCRRFRAWRMNTESLLTYLIYVVSFLINISRFVAFARVVQLARSWRSNQNDPRSRSHPRMILSEPITSSRFRFCSVRISERVDFVVIYDQINSIFYERKQTISTFHTFWIWKCFYASQLKYLTKKKVSCSRIEFALLYSLFQLG
jgi:hypothetical protein